MASHAEQRLEELRFRRMRPDDLEQVMVNEVRSYQFSWSRGVFEDCLRAGHECWVLESDGALIGHGILSIAAGEAHILNICVRPSEQGKGHGRALASHLLERARSRAEMVFLEVRPSNPIAIRLYESLGFNEIGLRKNYYPAATGREDALVFALHFTGPP
jgi:[ribosomal protein S18]-alanine N-acetyltransferase